MPPTIETTSAKIVSSGSITSSATSAARRGSASGSSPIERSASICSVTTIEPSSAAIAAPTRPATTTAVSIGPSSRTEAYATAPPTKLAKPYATACCADSSEITMPVKSDVSMTMTSDCTPSSAPCEIVSPTRIRSRAMKPSDSRREQRQAARIFEEVGRRAAETVEQLHRSGPSEPRPGRCSTPASPRCA